MESCTAGLIAFYLTAVDGSSDYVEKAYVTYSNDAKTALGVRRYSIENYCVYSAQVAKEMAFGAKRSATATYGLGITGLCGPNDHVHKRRTIPAGTVFISVVGPGLTSRVSGTTINVNDIGSRNEKRHFAAVAALGLLYRHIKR
jgi:nicotinamide-nucleotide amidase